MTTEDLRPDPEAIRATYHWLAHAKHGVSEVRVIRPGKGIVGIGFFDDEDAFVSECVRTNITGNVYVGIQPRPLRLLDLAPNAVRPLKSGAGRKDIEVVTATVIDLDPVRPKDTASTDAELQEALDVAASAADWCEARGLVRPRLMMSGNGTQLWFAVPPIELDDDSRELVQANLKAFEAELRDQLESERIKVDSIHDLPRIIKVIGSVSRKGEPTSERPHRLSVALEDIARIEDSELRARLLAQPALGAGEADSPEHVPARRPDIVSSVAGDVNRTPEGKIDWRSPVEMCGPVQRLWNEGAEDRSLAIFDMVRFFAHKGLGLDEITELVLEYDRRGLGKLQGRDGPAYIRNAYEKNTSSPRDDGTIAPPCHSLQGLGYCKVNREPGARCEHYDFVFDVEKAVEAIPEDCPAQELEYRLKPVLEAISFRNPSMHGRYLALLEKRFKLKLRDLRRALAQVGQRNHDVDDLPPPGAGDEGGDDTIEGEIYEDTCFYYVRTGRGETRVISSFTITPTMRVETEDGEILWGHASTDRGTRIDDLRLPLPAFHGKRDLVRHLKSADLQWTGSDNNVMGLLRVLARRPVPRRPGTTMLGEYRRGEHHVWVGPDCVLGPGGFLDPAPVVYVPSGASLDQRVRYRDVDDPTFDRVARAVFENLPFLNRPEVILPVIGWFFATPMKPRLMQKVGSFPALFIWGTQGSGKSCLCIDVFWPLFGVRDSEPYSATETEFALLKLLTATRSVPVFIDEYKPYDMQKQRLNTLHRYLRRLYRGETEERGRPDLRVNTYHLQAPVCIAGETRPIEAALLERILTSNPEKTTLDELPLCRRAFRELKAVDLSLFAPRYIQFCLGRELDADLEVAQAVAASLIGERTVPIRVVENLTVMLLGVYLFEEFAKSWGYELPDDLGARQAVDAVLADVLETDHGVKNALDHFVEMLGVLAIQGELKPKVHYVLDGSQLSLHLESSYDTFRAHCKRIDYAGEVVDLKALRRLVHESRRQGGYVISESERVCFDGKGSRRRAVVLDLDKTTLVSADDFAPPDHDAGGDDDRRDWRSRNGW